MPSPNNTQSAQLQTVNFLASQFQSSCSRLFKLVKELRLLKPPFQHFPLSMTLICMHCRKLIPQSVSSCLLFWNRGRGPNPVERHKASKDVLTLVRQWDCIVEKNGVLHRRVCRLRGKEVLQLVLPKSLKSQVLHQLHHNH